MTLQTAAVLGVGIVIVGLIVYGVRQYMGDEPWDELDEISRDDEDPKA